MKNYILGLIFVISPFMAFSHNPLSAKYYLDAGEQASLLTISLSQTGVDQVLIKKYGQEALEEINQKEFEELIVDYIKNNFDLSIDGKEIVLQKGGIKLGSHQTDLKFVLPPLSDKVEYFDIHIPAFQENENHQTIFSYNLNGGVDKEILNLRNNYRSTVRLSEASHSSAFIWPLLFSLVGLIFIIRMWSWRNQSFTTFKLYYNDKLKIKLCKN